MKKLQFERFTNVVKRALNEGFEIDETDSMNNILIDAENFLCKKDSADEMDYCNLSCGKEQGYIYYDEKGNFYQSDGYIFDFDAKYEKEDGVLFKKENDKFIPAGWWEIPMAGEGTGDEFVFVFDKIINTDGKIIALYDHFLN